MIFYPVYQSSDVYMTFLQNLGETKYFSNKKYNLLFAS